MQDQQHVYMVDTHVNYPPVAPRLGPPPPPRPPPPPPPPPGARSHLAVVTLLLCVLFCGMTAQAVFLYLLYHPTTTTTTTTANSPSNSPSSSKMTQDQGPAATCPPKEIVPPKPAAHLIGGPNIRHANENLSWSAADYGSFLQEMKYRDGKLLVKNDGFYFIYSKVYFEERSKFDHSVSLRTSAYARGRQPIVLLKARTYSQHPTDKSNSYLGGVFHLRKGDSLSVQVNNASQIIQLWPKENFFGAYMI